MRKTRMVLAGAAVSLALAGVVPAHARDVADNQGFCKRQGSSGCAGGSECAGPHLALLPLGQQKKC